MEEYIKKEAAMDIVRRTSGDYVAAFSEIRKFPAADVIPVQQQCALEWHEVKGYDYLIDYKYQYEYQDAELPELNECVLFLRSTDEYPFVGWVNDSRGGASIYGKHKLGDMGKLEDGVKWARFNMPNKKEK